MAKSLIDSAFEVLSAEKEGMAFMDLYNKSLELAGLNYSDSEKMRKLSSFYTQLTLDSRFTVLEGNKWDLAKRHTYEETHPVTDDEDDYATDIDPEEAEERAEEEKELYGEDYGEGESEEEEEGQSKEASLEIDD